MDKAGHVEVSFDSRLILVGGEWCEPSSREYIQLFNPSDGTPIGEIGRGKAEDVDAAVEAARHALAGPWGQMSPLDRGRLLTAIGRAVLEKTEELARLEALDLGKPLRQARADAIALARYFEFYGGAIDKFHGETIPYHQGYTVLTVHEPYGVTGHIIPWNYPMQIIGRSVAAALAMGNAAVLKPAEEACLTGLAFARIAQEAGLPSGALNVVTGLGHEAGAALSSHPGINHLSFTGSVATGAIVQSNAAKNAVPVTLELGGKSPQVVFADTDLTEAMKFLVTAGIQNAGQTCSASSRVLVERPIYDEVVGRMAEQYRQLRVGPAFADLDVGPLVTARQRDVVEGYINLARGGDLKIVAEAEIVPDAPKGGFYVRPTLACDVSSDHRLAQEEIFGPVQVIIPFEGEDEAIEIANGTDFGLVAGVWTRDGARQLRMARALHAGQVFVNNYGAAGGVELPFGGVKLSGHGREKGIEALHSFSTLKTIAILHG
jgi:aldehyde dehydrogenase (NAD+)